MSMQELTDDQLDGLFRKSAEEFNSPPDPVAWQAMSQLLDAHNQTVPVPKPSFWRKNRGLGLAVLLLLLLSVGTWITYRQLRSGNGSSVTSQNSLTSPNIVARQTTPLANSPLASRSAPTQRLANSEYSYPKITEVAHSKPIAEITHSNPVKINRRTNLPIATADEQRSSEKIVVYPANKPERTILSEKKSGIDTHPARTSRTRLESAGSVTYKAAGTASKTNRAGLKNKVVISRSVHLTRRRLMSTSRSTVSSTSQYATKQLPAFTNRPLLHQTTANNVDQTAEPVLNKAVELGAMPAIAELARRLGKWPKPMPFMSRELVLPDTGEAAFFRKPLVQSQPRQTGLSIRLIVAPDLSVIGLKDFQRPGTNVGLMTEYRLATRWSIQAGVLQSTKVYKSNTLPAYTQKWMVQPESVSGQCKILDIPLNIRYDMAFRPDLNGQIRGRWFVSGGLTSYIMWKEDYVYNYADPNSPHIYDPMRGWHGRTGWNGFSQLNLSAGYEQVLSRRLSWQVEPFLKIPLKGVGYYKIDLLSTGAFFSLRYKL